MSTSIDNVPNMPLTQFNRRSFPDLMEVRTDSQGNKQLVFFYVRRISRQLDAIQTSLAHTLEDFGHSVRMSVFGVEMSLEEFEKKGVYGVVTSKTVQSKQGLYNKVSELRSLEGALEKIDRNDPRFYTLARRVHNLREMLNTSLPTVSQEELRKSDERLHRLAALLKEGEEHVESKPDVAGEVNAPTKDGTGSAPVVTDVD